MSLGKLVSYIRAKCRSIAMALEKWVENAHGEEFQNKRDIKANRPCVLHNSSETFLCKIMTETGWITLVSCENSKNIQQHQSNSIYRE